jgi:hypothetical protein
MKLIVENKQEGGREGRRTGAKVSAATLKPTVKAHQTSLGGISIKSQGEETS